MTPAALTIDSVVVGRSARMRAVFEFLRVIGNSESTVLITGESGTGKEVTATLIHQASRLMQTLFEIGFVLAPILPPSAVLLGAGAVLGFRRLPNLVDCFQRPFAWNRASSLRR